MFDHYPFNEVRQKLLHSSKRHTLEARSIVIHAGEQAHSLFFILNGSVSVYTENADGHELVLDYLNTGDYVGEMGLFCMKEPHRRTAWVCTRRESILAEITYKRFLQLCDAHPQLLMSLNRQTLKRLHRTTQKAYDLNFLDVSQRLLRVIHNLGKQPDAITHESGQQIHVTRQEISRHVGCSREMVGRVLDRFQEQGMIQVMGKTIIILPHCQPPTCI